MQELGIVGERVTEINSKEFIPADMSRIIDDIYNINNADIIIVVKNKGSFDKLKEMYDGNNTLRYSDSSYKEIYQGEISVLPLGTVIGMEFPNVIVYSYSMTASQRYIAYTRATKELVVIE